MLADAPIDGDCRARHEATAWPHPQGARRMMEMPPNEMLGETKTAQFAGNGDPWATPRTAR
jgi:hypothetical protein